MVEVKFSVANCDLAPMRSWAAESRRELSKVMVSSVPTARSGRATLVYATLGLIDAQLLQQQENLKALARRGR